MRAAAMINKPMPTTTRSAIQSGRRFGAGRVAQVLEGAASDRAPGLISDRSCGAAGCGSIGSGAIGFGAAGR